MPDDTTRQTEPTPCERNVHAADRTVFALAIVLTLFSTAALAQSRTFYGADGKVLGRSTTDRNGATTFYDASGRVTGRTTTGSKGTKTIYGADGRKAGSVEPQQKQEKR